VESGLKYKVVPNNQDTVITLLNGEKKQVLKLTCSPESAEYITWIQDIGDTHGFSNYLQGCSPSNKAMLRCFYKNGELVYKNENAEECWTTSTKETDPLRFIIAPNPSSNFIEIKTEQKYDKAIIYGLAGNVQMTSSQANTIDISHLPNGLYFIELINNGKSIGTQKFIKIR
jgi:hypothetical protein